MDKFKITVFCEIKRDETAAQVSYELAAKASSLAKNIENSEVQILIIGKRMNYDSIIDNFSKLGADKVIIVNDNVFADYSLNLYRKAACEILAKEKPQIAEIIEVGPGGEIDGKPIKMYVKKGDRVIVSKYAGTEVKIDGEDYIIVKQDDILAIVE